ncbi:hypothetical protein O3W44_24585 [Pantoea sp. LMR881]|uniref:hypothetical protein n=1 Tax=Pantoea sp. LMR881 TaxID=3014336 RepID=UPI0022B076EC|nr:hypothetical protein [Pantoea sp. LMR881]MCZ4061631.1 hypothetical protein [Pantoea sp. LMR881]
MKKTAVDGVNSGDVHMAVAQTTQIIQLCAYPPKLTLPVLAEFNKISPAAVIRNLMDGAQTTAYPVAARRAISVDQ